MDPMAAINAARLIVKLVGDARAWNDEVRMWCYDHAHHPPKGPRDEQEAERRKEAEALEAWVGEVEGGFGRQRREALKMRCYDAVPNHSRTPRLDQATSLYLWAVKAEALRGAGEEPEGGQDEPRGFVP